MRVKSKVGSPSEDAVTPSRETGSHNLPQNASGNTQEVRGQIGLLHDHNGGDLQGTAEQSDHSRLSQCSSGSDLKNRSGQSEFLNPLHGRTGSDPQCIRERKVKPGQTEHESDPQAMRARLTDNELTHDTGERIQRTRGQLTNTGLDQRPTEGNFHGLFVQSINNGNSKPPSVVPSLETSSPNVDTVGSVDIVGLDQTRPGVSSHDRNVQSNTITDTNEDPRTLPIRVSIGGTDSHSYLLLGFYGDMLDDFEALRMATANRRRALTDPSEHGHGLSVLLPEIGVIDSSLKRLIAIEHEIELSLKRAMRSHPLGPWVKNTIGIGEKQMARLLGVIGDPGTRETVKQLNAYCGMDVRDGHAPRREKGVKSNWNDRARSRLYVIAESCIKQARSPYRVVYESGRVKYRDVVHENDCRQCKVQAGKPLSLGHQHARAMRLVMKAILLDLWRESVRIHE